MLLIMCWNRLAGNESAQSVCVPVSMSFVSSWRRQLPPSKPLNTRFSVELPSLNVMYDRCVTRDVPDIRQTWVSNEVIRPPEGRCYTVNGRVHQIGLSYLPVYICLMLRHTRLCANIFRFQLLLWWLYVFILFFF